MIQILDIINQYTGLISLAATGLGGLAFWWLSTCFYSKKEAEEDRKRYSQRFEAIERVQKDHGCYLRDFPNKDEVNSLNVAIVELKGKINTLNIKNEGLEDKMDQIIGNLNMLTEYHINRGHNG